MTVVHNLACCTVVVCGELMKTLRFTTYASLTKMCSVEAFWKDYKP